MRPRFGLVTHLLAVVFILSGVGAGSAGLSAGHQSTPGHATDKAILFLLAVGFSVVGVSLGLKYLWAWWAGIAVACFVVVFDLALRASGGGWIPWSAFLLAFVVSAVQGVRDERLGRGRNVYG